MQLKRNTSNHYQLTIDGLLDLAYSIMFHHIYCRVDTLKNLNFTSRQYILKRKCLNCPRGGRSTPVHFLEGVEGQEREVYGGGYMNAISVDIGSTYHAVTLFPAQTNTSS